MNQESLSIEKREDTINCDNTSDEYKTKYFFTDLVVKKADEIIEKRRKERGLK